MPNAQCTLPNAQCIMPNAQCTLHKHMSNYNAAWTASLLMSLACKLALCSFCPYACCKVQLCISFVELPILSSRLASWLASVTHDNRTGRKKTLWSGLRYPAIYCQRGQDYHILISAELALNVFTMHANYLSSAVKLACPPI